ncbi:MAG TPA: hypothetical protein VFO86_16325 [Terriglobia bacterium]|nr:hypothetical protein [Terriglobia bacterium]
MFIEFRITGSALHHCRVNILRLQPSTLNFPDIDGVDSINKLTIPFSRWVEVGPQDAGYKNVDDIAEPEKEIKVKALQERKPILGFPANPATEQSQS